MSEALREGAVETEKDPAWTMRRQRADADINEISGENGELVRFRKGR